MPHRATLVADRLVDRKEWSLDVLSDLFNEMYLSGEVVACFDLTAPWGIKMPPHGGIFHAIDNGDCWIRLTPDGEPFLASAGDLIIFPEAAAHEIYDAPSSKSIPLDEALGAISENTFNCPFGGGGSGTKFICGIFHFRNADHHAFRSLLPPVLHVRGGDREAQQWMRSTLRRLSEEAVSTSPGAHTVISRLTDVLFIEGVRTWLDDQTSEATGLLSALNDPLVGEALSRIHGDPSRKWTIESIAAEVGLSRSAFAAHFTRFVGEPPVKYLTRWRMQLAQNWLHGTTTAVGDIADQLGYASEDAFKRAFKREVGLPPGAYRRNSVESQLVS